MGALSNLFRWRRPAAGEARNINNPAQPVDQNVISALMGGAPSSAGVTVNERRAMQLATVYACVNVLSETIGTLPLHVMERTANGKKAAPTHPTQWLLHDEPNPTMTASTFIGLAMTHCPLWGNAYAQIQRRGSGEVAALWPLMPWACEPRRVTAERIVYDVRLDDGSTVTLEADEVLHFPALGFDGLKGLSPIQMARNALGVAIAAEDFGARFFANDARPGLIIETPPSMGPEAATRLKAQLADAHSGAANRHKVMVLGPGLKATTVSMPLDDAQFIATRDYERSEILSLFRMPPTKIGLWKDAKYASAEHADLDFEKNCLLPWLVKIEQELNRKLYGRGSPFFAKFNLDGLRRGEFAGRMTGYRTGIAAGVFTQNEVRELEDMEPMEGADRLQVPLNMGFLEDDGTVTNPNDTGAQGAEAGPGQPGLPNEGTAPP